MKKAVAHQQGAVKTPSLYFWLLPLYTPFIVILMGLVLYTAACAIHYLYTTTHP